MLSTSRLSTSPTLRHLPHQHHIFLLRQDHFGLPHKHTTPTRNTICHAILSQTGPPEQLDGWPRYGIIHVKCLL